MRHLKRAALVILAAGLAAGVAAQTANTHPVSGRRFAPVMGYQGADWLERAERIDEEAPDVAIDLLNIRKGAAVADIGAGSGDMTVRLARPAVTEGRG